MYTMPYDQMLILVITSVTEIMAGKYICLASYAKTKQLKAEVNIQTDVPITWINAPQNQSAVAGKDYTVQCEVTASPAPSVFWFRYGVPMKIDEKFVIQTVKGLLIKNVQESDDGIYTCMANVSETSQLAKREIRLEVQVSPKVQPFTTVELEGVEDQPFSVKCNATGKPAPSYTWIKDSEQLNLELNAERFRVNPLTGQLSILNVSKDDYGNYTCKATNSVGEDEAKILINVLNRPKIIGMWNITRPEHEDAELICRATGRPPPEITFRRWGSTRTDEFQPGDIYLEQSGVKYIGESRGVLRFNKLRRSDDGLYECVARNKGDSAYKVGHIAVEYAPTFEHMESLPPIVYTENEQRANLSCLAEGFPNATIEWIWNDRPIRGLNDPNLQVEGNGPRSDLLIIPRERRYYSTYKCIAKNRHGTAQHYMELRKAPLQFHLSNEELMCMQ